MEIGSAWRPNRTEGLSGYCTDDSSDSIVRSDDLDCLEQLQAFDGFPARYANLDGALKRDVLDHAALLLWALSKDVVGMDVLDLAQEPGDLRNQLQTAAHWRLYECTAGAREADVLELFRQMSHWLLDGQGRLDEAAAGLVRHVLRAPGWQGWLGRDRQDFVLQRLDLLLGRSETRSVLEGICADCQVHPAARLVVQLSVRGRADQAPSPRDARCAALAAFLHPPRQAEDEGTCWILAWQIHHHGERPVKFLDELKCILERGCCEFASPAGLAVSTPVTPLSARAACRQWTRVNTFDKEGRWVADGRVSISSIHSSATLSAILDGLQLCVGQPSKRRPLVNAALNRLPLDKKKEHRTGSLEDLVRLIVKEARREAQAHRMRAEKCRAEYAVGLDVREAPFVDALMDLQRLAPVLERSDDEMVDLARCTARALEQHALLDCWIMTMPRQLFEHAMHVHWKALVACIGADSRVSALAHEDRQRFEAALQQALDHHTWFATGSGTKANWMAMLSTAMPARGYEQGAVAITSPAEYQSMLEYIGKAVASQTGLNDAWKAVRSSIMDAGFAEKLVLHTRAAIKKDAEYWNPMRDSGRSMVPWQLPRYVGSLKESWIGGKRCLSIIHSPSKDTEQVLWPREAGGLLAAIVQRYRARAEILGEVPARVVVTTQRHDFVLLPGDESLGDAMNPGHALSPRAWVRARLIEPAEARMATEQPVQGAKRKILDALSALLPQAAAEAAGDRLADALKKQKQSLEKFTIDAVCSELKRQLRDPFGFLSSARKDALDRLLFDLAPTPIVKIADLNWKDENGKPIYLCATFLYRSRRLGLVEMLGDHIYKSQELSVVGDKGLQAWHFKTS